MPVEQLHEELMRALRAYRAQRAFDPATWVTAKCAKLNAYMTKHHLATCVTNVSGGVDSAVVLALCARAMRVEGGSPIRWNVGVCQPIHSSPWALERGHENITACGATAVTVDQTALHSALATAVEAAVQIPGKEFARGQLASYMRTPVAYYIAQLYSQQGSPAIVMGTGNMDEDLYLGYFCKAGDGTVDVQLIADLHKSEVFAVARYLGVPERTCNAVPSADLWEGQTDEDELGFPYDFVELFVGWYKTLNESSKLSFFNGLSPAARTQFTQYAKACEVVHGRNAHKLHSPIDL